MVSVVDCSSEIYCSFTRKSIGFPITSSDAKTLVDRFSFDCGFKFSKVHFEFPSILTVSACDVRVITRSVTGIFPSLADRKSTRLNSSHANIYTLSLHDALPIYLKYIVVSHENLLAFQ